jgi:uncharacterized protein
MTPAIATALVDRVREHIKQHRLTTFTVVLHGGEPLLFGKSGMWRLCEALQQVGKLTRCRLRLCVTTNGVLLDEDWALIFAGFDVAVTLSIDGPPALHDERRPDLRGRPTHARVLEALAHLRATGREPGILCVVDPVQDPAALLDYFVDDLSVFDLDLLIPDATHEDHVPSIALFLIGLFDHWHDHAASRGVRVRFLDAVIRGLAGRWSGVESIGYGPVGAVTVTTDGQIEAHDVCRIAGNDVVSSTLNVRNDDLDAVRGEPAWKAIWTASLDLPALCQACEWRHACGGGHIASRWSQARGFDNPSVYCADLKLFFSHVWTRIAPDLVYVVEEPAHVG